MRAARPPAPCRACSFPGALRSFFWRQQHRKIDAHLVLDREASRGHAESAATDLATDLDRAGDARLPTLRRQHLKHHRTEHTTRSEEHTSELQSLMRISYAVFCLKKKNKKAKKKLHR